MDVRGLWLTQLDGIIAALPVAAFVGAMGTMQGLALKFRHTIETEW